MPSGAAQAREGSSARALLPPRRGGRGRGAGRGLPRQRQGRAPRPSPQRSARLSPPAGDDETPPGRAAVPESRGRAGEGMRPPQGSAGERAELLRRAGAAPLRRRRRLLPSFFPSSPARPSRPCRPAAGARRWGRCPRGGAGRARRGRAEAEGAGLTYSAPAGPSRASR